MAKAVKEGKKFEFSKVGSILDNIAKSIPIQIEKEIKEKTFITTGVYLLDAALSGRLLGGGVASNRITAFAGESGAGKSFIAYSVSKHAQKAGYCVIYIDTEQAIDLEDLPKFGIDNSLEAFRLIRSNKVEDVNMLLTQLIDDLKEQKLAGFELPKLMIVLDSLGQMASNKEKADFAKRRHQAGYDQSKSIRIYVPLDQHRLRIPRHSNDRVQPHLLDARPFSAREIKRRKRIAILSVCDRLHV